MVLRRILIGSLALVASVATACTDDPSASAPGPDAASLLRDAAGATRNIRSAHFTLKVDGQLPGVPVHSAEGDLTREGGPSGAAKGTVNMDLLGQLFEGEFVLVNDSVYIKGATGGFQQLPASLVSNIYDPSAILNPDKGIAKVLSSVQDPRSEGTESVDGTSAYKVSGRVGKDVVRGLVPGVESDVDITFWLRQDNKQPVKASVKSQGGDGGTATVDVTLSDVDKPVTITPPN
ncbi:MAG TPA: LppX_LprAFG lipoprotein [Actinophytocola sp.]|uniref:LppX_LprAFG lipoprotein n=1 Tax=Actinophytocola sp. TaxID=1872138 RepID=UPI002DDCAED9|nr:LppX_LprAFG lipoprotein [Actinophytocola sp.]HEV2780165.1 LppX_LprAFG lipoprotein [Actinophytocola sp.]